MFDISKPEHEAYLWLAVAALLNIFTFGKWSVPLAAWLMPIFLLRFLRAQSVLRGFFWAGVAFSVVNYFAGKGLAPLPEPFYAISIMTATLVGLRGILPYLADRVMARGIGGLWGTLALPTAFVVWEYFIAITNPNGSWGSIAYTQAENLPLIQLVSVVGIWGIVFLIYWTAAVVNWAWERGFAWPEIRRGARLYGGVMAAVLLLGGARLAFSAPTSATIRVAAVAAPTMQRYLEIMGKDVVRQMLQGQTLDESESAEAKAALASLNDELFALSQQEAQNGAKFVFWAEGAANVLAWDEENLVKRGRELARQEQIYLGMAMSTIKPGLLGENKLVLINPSGDVVWEYNKSHLWEYNKLHLVLGPELYKGDRRVPILSTPFGRVLWEYGDLLVPGPESLVYVQGDGKMPTMNTPYGNIAAGICHDMDHHEFVQQAGKADTDLFFVPAGDWSDMSRMRLNVAVMRAVEQGMTVVRPTINGIAAAVDPQGRVIASMERSEAGVRILLDNPPFALETKVSPKGRVSVAEVPTRGMRTIYTYVKDVLAWLCIVGFFVLVGLALFRLFSLAASEAQEVEPDVD